MQYPNVFCIYIIKEGIIRPIFNIKSLKPELDEWGKEKERERVCCNVPKNEKPLPTEKVSRGLFYKIAKRWLFAIFLNEFLGIRIT